MFVLFSVAWIISRCLGLRTKKTKETHEIKKKEKKTMKNMEQIFFLVPNWTFRRRSSGRSAECAMPVRGRKKEG